MSIASEISRINQNISAAYTACSDKGATLPAAQNSANLADTIESITSESRDTLERKDINFFDYDGTLLYSYSAEQAAQLSSLPALPSHDGLICQGWNHTLAQVIAAERADVGCNYDTDDGSTRLYCSVLKDCKINSLRLDMMMEPGQSATVYWGDGTSSVVSNTGASTAFVAVTKNNYTEVSTDTVLCIRIVGGRFQLGRGTSTTVFGYGVAERQYIPAVKKIEIGSNCIGINSDAFYNCNSLETVSVPSGVAGFGNSAFANCYNLKSFTIPSGVTSISDMLFYNCDSLESVAVPVTVSAIGNSAFASCFRLLSAVIPFGATTIGRRAFNACHVLSSVSIPASVTSIGEEAFSQCWSLRTAIVDARLQTVPNGLFGNCISLTKVTLPDSLPYIGDYMFRSSNRLYSIVIPSSVTSIGNMAFYGSGSMISVDMTAFTDPDSIPTLTNSYSSDFYNLAGKVYVANAEMLSAFRNATNWSTFPTNKIAVKEAST